jgi:hypothetical protein
MMLVAAISMLGMPKLLAMLDPETVAEVQQNQADMHSKIAVRWLLAHTRSNKLLTLSPTVFSKHGSCLGGVEVSHQARRSATSARQASEGIEEAKVALAGLSLKRRSSWCLLNNEREKLHPRPTTTTIRLRSLAF